MKPRFTKKVKILLAEKVGHECSNPECCVRTSGPSTDSKTSVNLGEAAHIHGCFQERPRYKPGISEQELNSEANGIWLCGKCHKLIDSDPNGYSAEILRGWKDGAERKARLRHASAWNQPEERLSDAIRASLRAQENQLYNLDPRFKVRLEANAKRIRGDVIPRENVPLRLIGTGPEEVDKKIREGRSFSINGYISGSRLFDCILGGHGSIEFSPSANRIFLDFVGPKGSIISGQFNAYPGSEYLRACSDDSFKELEIELLIPLSHGRKQVFNIQFKEILARDKKLSSYVGYKKAVTLIDAIKIGGIELFLIEGINKHSLGTIKSSDEMHLDRAQQFIFNLCRIDIAHPELDLSVPEMFSHEQHSDIHAIANLLNGNSVYSEIAGGLKLSYEGDIGFFEDLKRSQQRGHIMMHFRSGEISCILGDKGVPFPEHTRHYRNFIVADLEASPGSDPSNQLVLQPLDGDSIEQILAPGFATDVPGESELVNSPKMLEIG